MFTFFRNKKKIIAAVAIVAAVIIVVSSVFIVNALNSIDCDVAKTEDGAVKIKANLEELKTKNIEIGDSINVSFDTSYEAEDVPFLNGFYMNSGRHIMVIQDENSSPVFLIQDVPGIWEKASLKDNSKVHISVCEKAKYKHLNNALNLPITGDVKDVRSLRGGNLKFLDIFRGANPSYSAETNTQLPYYFKTLGITNMINLSNNEFGIKSFDIKVPSCNYLVANTLTNLSNNNNKTYIYSDNSDMTAYFCAICMALAGCSYDEIINDYMETYKNLYGITKEDYPSEYEAIKTYKIDEFLHKFTKTPLNYDMHNCDFSYDAEMYLRTIQMDTEEIQKITMRLSK